MNLPVILHIPHASRLIPDPVRSDFVATDEAIELELLRHTDAFTDELFDLPGAEKLVFPVSRLVVDPERFRNDADEVMAQRGLGAVYTKTADGKDLKLDAHREELLSEFYDPHHRRLEEWVESALQSAETCLIVDCHSFPSQSLPCDLDQSPSRPDACLGTDVFHTPMGLIESASRVIRDAGWNLEIDRPYAGTIVPIRHYRTDPRVWSIMVEVSRRLYMDEATGAKSDGFDATRRTVSLVLQTLAAS